MRPVFGGALLGDDRRGHQQLSEKLLEPRAPSVRAADEWPRVKAVRILGQAGGKRSPEGSLALIRLHLQKKQVERGCTGRLSSIAKGLLADVQALQRRVGEALVAVA